MALLREICEKSDDDKSTLSETVDSTKNSLRTDRLDMSFGEIMNIYEDNELIINPQFQRLFRWSIEQQTRFIESLILGIPIPPIFVAEDDNGKWELVDGLQRLSTVLSFFGVLKTATEKNKWIMSEGELIDELLGFNIDNFPFRLLLNIKRAVCRVEIINWNSKIDMRYELFNRLNTGGTPLTQQEIRNCIFRGTSEDFNDYLEAMALNEEFRGLIKLSKSKVDQMYLEELVLRFTSLVDNWESMDDSLSNYMSGFMRDAVQTPDFDYDRYSDLLERTFKVLSIYDESIFIANNNNFSTSLYEGITIAIANNIDYYENHTDVILVNINTLKEDEEFKSYMGSAASSKNRVQNRIRRAMHLFSVTE